MDGLVWVGMCGGCLLARSWRVLVAAACQNGKGQCGVEARHESGEERARCCLEDADIEPRGFIA